MKKLVAAALAAIFTVAASPAWAADPVVGVYAAQPDVCADGRVLGRISQRFDYQVRHVPHLPQVGISAFDRIATTRYEPAHPESPIERRYCRGVVGLSNGHWRDFWFLVESRMGFAGIGSNVEFCVDGFDRWHVYGGRCRVLR